MLPPEDDIEPARVLLRLAIWKNSGSARWRAELTARKFLNDPTSHYNIEQGTS
jgi:hypothetical protein